MDEHQMIRKIEKLEEEVEDLKARFEPIISVVAKLSAIACGADYKVNPSNCGCDNCSGGDLDK